MANFSALSKSELFSGIEPDQIPLLLDCLGARSRTYPEGGLILAAGEPVTGIGLLCAGKARIVREDVLGNRNVIALLEPGELFAETFACAKLARLPVSVEAVSPAEVLLLDYARLVNTCPSACGFHRQLLQNMLGVLARKSLYQNQKLRIMSERGIRAKLTAFLLEYAPAQSGREFAIPFNRQELADYLAVERSALSRELSKMRAEGLLDFKRNTFVWNGEKQSDD